MIFKNFALSYIVKKKNTYIIYTLLLISLFYSCTKTDHYKPITPIAVHLKGLSYAGSKTCAKCHFDIYKSHLETAHYNTSAIADSISVKGSFLEEQSYVEIGKDFKLVMTKNDSSIYQQTHSNYKNRLLSKTKLDIVIGSGTKGQSFLTWKDDKLFQIQASYNTPAKSWINSPGFPNFITNLRPIKPRCLECHATFAKNIVHEKIKNRYENRKIIFGVDCERCHGPSAKHVGFHLSNPEVTTAKFMIPNKKLSRQQNLDACALCHSGLRKNPKQIPFTFVTGDKLTNFSEIDYQKGEEINLDVHGNQYGLLTASSCFKETKTMTCITCHNPHKNERNNMNNFNTKCISCHSKPKTICKENKNTIAFKNNNCVQCHMPLLPSKSMKINKENDTIPVMVRTHLIDIYQ